MNNETEHLMTGDPAHGLQLTLHMLESILMIDKTILKKEKVTVNQLLNEILPVISGAHHNITEILNYFAMIEQDLIETGELSEAIINKREIH